MAFIKTFKFLYSKVRISAKKLETRSYLFSRAYGAAKNSSVEQYTANILIVKNPIYCELAKICVASFLYFHPKSHVLVHVDQSTEAKSREAFKHYIKKNKVKITLVEVESLSWQQQKIKVIFSMKESNHFFMDADLRWNGIIPALTGTTFFVEEFVLGDRSPYAHLVNHETLREYANASMKNTSFVHWGKNSVSMRDLETVYHLEQVIVDIANSDFLPKDDRSGVIRISEQIALSLFAHNLDLKINYLKESDAIKDGSFLESSYFGVTGSFL
jgi:hypothetical protein